MTIRFGNRRLFFYISVFLLAGSVLGISANLASLFLPDLHHDFIIFALIVPSVTIFAFLLSLQWAQPRTEAVMLFIVGVLWLAMGAWSADIIGPIQCDGLGGQTTPTKNGSTSLRSYCYQMKVIEAFSWMTFVLFAISLIILITLVGQAERFGRYKIWEEPIRELPWFGEAPGYYNQGMPVQQQQQYPAGYMPYGYGQPQMMTTPGQSIIVQPGINGAPPTVTHVPM